MHLKKRQMAAFIGGGRLYHSVRVGRRGVGVVCPSPLTKEGLTLLCLIMKHVALD